ncbi:MAG: alpha/beta hydrolase [Thermoplasmata archaeon]|nr:alpha/beta hydrolase [Thermoplasmata archaeon]
MPLAHLAETDLFYETRGDAGDPVVLVHGSLVDRSVWARLIPLLSQSVTVLTYDRRGFGASPSGATSRPVKTDVADLAHLLEALDLFPVHLITHSYGGSVAFRLASERPELVRSLSIHEPPLLGLLADQASTATEGHRLLDEVSTICDQVRDGKSVEAAREVVEVFSTEPGAWERLPPSTREEFAGRMNRWREEYSDPDSLRLPPGLLSELMLPILLTSGSESPRFLTDIRHVLTAQLPNVTELQLPGAGHAPHVTHPSEYAGLLLSFLLERNVPTH